MLDFLKDCFKKFLLLVCPLYCVSCLKPDITLCSQCFNKLNDEIKPQLEKVQSVNNIKEVPLVFSGKYADTWRDVILSYKDHGRADLLRIINLVVQVSFKLSQEAINKLAKDTKNRNSQSRIVIIPAPSSKQSIKKRGFWQAEEIATCLAKQFMNKGIEAFVEKVLVQKNIKKQVSRSGQERAQNKRGKIKIRKFAFKADTVFQNRNTASKQNNIYILVDDIVTSGATISECLRILKISNMDIDLIFALAKV